MRARSRWCRWGQRGNVSRFREQQEGDGRGRASPVPLLGLTGGAVFAALEIRRGRLVSPDVLQCAEWRSLGLAGLVGGRGRSPRPRISGSGLPPGVAPIGVASAPLRRRVGPSDWPSGVERTPAVGWEWPSWSGLWCAFKQRLLEGPRVLATYAERGVTAALTGEAGALALVSRELVGPDPIATGWVAVVAIDPGGCHWEVR